jgi:hypothetical protein
VDFRVEGNLQTGERAGTDVSAYMVGLRVGGKLHESTTATAWLDYLSGDDDPDDEETGVFNTLFATNHAFYGLADYFLNIPVDTRGLGLQDAALKFSFSLSPTTTLRIDLHNFRAAEKGFLTTRTLANELDLTLSHSLTNVLTLMTGYSFVQARDGIKELERLSEDAQWLYLMLDAQF